MVLARGWPLSGGWQFQNHQVLADEMFTPAHGLDTIRARACPDTGTWRQGNPDLIGSGGRFRFLQFERADHTCSFSSVRIRVKFQLRVGG